MQTDPIGYEDDVNLYAYSKNDPVNLVDPSGETAVKYFIKLVDRGYDYYREVQRKQAVRARERGMNVKVVGPGHSSKAASIEKEVSGNANVRHDVDSPHGSHYQPRNRKSGPEGRGHTDHAATLSAIAAALTAEHYLGADSLIAQAVDLFNPIADLKEGADLVSKVMNDSSSEQAALAPMSNDSSGNQERGIGAAHWSIDGDVITGTRACGSRIENACK